RDDTRAPECRGPADLAPNRHHRDLRHPLDTRGGLSFDSRRGHEPSSRPNRQYRRHRPAPAAQRPDARERPILRARHGGAREPARQASGRRDRPTVGDDRGAGQGGGIGRMTRLWVALRAYGPPLVVFVAVIAIWEVSTDGP